MNNIVASFDFCCKKFKKANKSGLIYLGILAPNKMAWMSEVNEMLEDKDLKSHVNFAGASGVSWRWCPYCEEELIK